MGHLQRDCGESYLPLSLNYVWVAAQAMTLFLLIENKLKELRNPTYVRAHEIERSLSSQKRVALASFALAQEKRRGRGVFGYYGERY